MSFLVGPTGRLSKGHVLDCNERAFNEALKFYDSKLYTVWNPKKVAGWGCWEIRREPNTKSIVYKGSHGGIDYHSLEYVESNLIHHVLDAAFLNYDAIRKLKEMDSWGNKNWIDDLERREAELQAEIREKARAELKYAIKQNRSMAKDLLELAQQGIDPAQVLTKIKWAQNS